MALYDAFISYNHAKDKPVAAALQSVIQKLGKPWYRRRALRLFRDDTGMAANAGLWPSVEQALGNSGFLILFASPEAAASQWVSKEVSWWLDHKRVDTLLIALTSGELVWNNAVGDFVWREGMPLPPVLTGRFVSEPKWVDLRAYRDGADPRDARFIEAGADFAAAIHGMPKEDLLSQEVRQQRRALALAWSAAGTLAVLIVLAGWQWWEAEGAKRAAVASEQVATEQRDIAQQQRAAAERNLALARKAAEDLVFKVAQGLRDVQGMRIESVRRILETAQGVMDELVKSAPDDLQLQRSRAGMLDEFATTYLRAGDLARARAAAEESLTILRKLATADSGNAGWQHDLSANLERVGDVRLAAGDRAGALAAYEEALAISRKLAAADPGHAESQRDLGVSLDRVGDLRLATGDRDGARAAYEEALAIRRKLVAADPGNTVWQRDLSVSLDRIGDVRLDAGDRAGALAVYEEALTIRRKLAAADPGNAGRQRDLGVSLQGVGDVRLAGGDRDGARAAYEESLAIFRKLAAVDPGNAAWQRDLGVSLLRVGDMRLDAGDRDGARAAYEESVGVFRKLTTADPGNAGWQADLVFGLFKASTVSDPPQARALLREALAIVETLEREGRLTDAQRGWPKALRGMLTKLPPETADAQ